MLTKHIPSFTGSAAVYPYTAALDRACRTQDRFGNEFSYAIERSHDGKRCLWLPRAAAPAGTDLRAEGQPFAFGCNFTPRNPEQARIHVEGVRELLNGESFVIQAPTGWGKTVIGCAIAAKVRRRTLVVTTKEDIMDQWLTAATSIMGLDPSQVGFWRGDTVPKPDQPFVVALVQSVLKGPERYPEVDFASFGLVICDEVHRMGADQFSQSMWWFPAKLRLGLSATPYRKDGREGVFFNHIGPVKLTAKMETMIPKIIVRRSEWKVPRVKRYDRVLGEATWVRLPHEAGKTMHLSVAMARDEKRNALIGKFVQAGYKRQRNTIVFCDTVEHLHALRDTCIGVGVPEQDIGYYVGLSSGVYPGRGKEKKQVRDAAKAKRVILATYQMASEATDIPWLDACVLATPRSDVVQIVGRIRREYPEKPTPVVFDIVDEDSPVFAHYARSRLRWYHSIGCEVVQS
jgi:superfamily II DNA or RNA helicase